MTTYSLNPYVSFVESRLFPQFVQYAVFHRLTGEIFEPTERVREVLLAIRSNTQTASSDDAQLRPLIDNQFLVTGDFDPLAPLLDCYVTRPIHNPAVAYRARNGTWTVVRTSMEHSVYSRKLNEMPPVVEEELSPLQADIFLAADG